MSPGSRRARPSLKRRLLLLQLVVSGGLLLASPVTYLVMSRAIEREFNVELGVLARTMAPQLPLAAEPGRAGEPRPCLSPRHDLALAADELRHLLLVDANGVVLCTSGAPVPLAPAAVARAHHTRAPVYVEVTVRGEDLRLVAWPIHAGGRHFQVLELARSDEVVNRTLRSGLFALVAADLAALALLLAGSWALARHTYGPIDRLVRSIEAIDEQRLDERLRAEHPDDELGRLVAVLNRLLDRIERAFAGQARFSSDVSHEIRSPLTALRGQMEVALRKERTVAEYQHFLRECLPEVLRLARLSDDLLNLARADADALEPEFEPLALGDLLQQAANYHRGGAAAKGVRLELDVAAAPVVIGDADLLSRVFENLLDNAIRHTSPGGAVQLLASVAGDRAAVAVRDAGEGIPAEHLPHVFDRFYRVDSARARSSGGAGLGLSIAHQIVALHGGEIEVASVVGEGTVFTVELPLAPA